MTDRRRLVPIVARRRIEKVFGLPPAALPVANILTPSRRLPISPPSTTAPRRAARIGWPDLDEVLAPSTEPAASLEDE